MYQITRNLNDRCYIFFSKDGLFQNVGLIILIKEINLCANKMRSSSKKTKMRSCFRDSDRGLVRTWDPGLVRTSGTGTGLLLTPALGPLSKQSPATIRTVLSRLQYIGITFTQYENDPRSRFKLGPYLLPNLLRASNSTSRRIKCQHMFNNRAIIRNPHMKRFYEFRGSSTILE